ETELVADRVARIGLDPLAQLLVLHKPSEQLRCVSRLDRPFETDVPPLLGVLVVHAASLLRSGRTYSRKATGVKPRLRFLRGAHARRRRRQRCPSPRRDEPRARCTRRPLRDSSPGGEPPRG